MSNGTNKYTNPKDDCNNCYYENHSTKRCKKCLENNNKIHLPFHRKIIN